MKIFLALTVLLGFSAAWACGADGKTEAYVFGQMININHVVGGEAGEIEHTTYQMRIFENHTMQNTSCPLDIELASQNIWWIQGSPDLKEGQRMAGTLVHDTATNIFYFARP